MPPTIAEVRQFWSDYLDREARFQAENRMLTEATLAYCVTFVPKPFRPLSRLVLLVNIDPRIVRACGRKPLTRWQLNLGRWGIRLLGQRDPVPDGQSRGIEQLARKVYPNGWKISELGTPVEAMPATQ